MVVRSPRLRRLSYLKDIKIALFFNCDFPGSTQWVSLADVKGNIQNIMSYFIERTAIDNEANKDYKNVSSKAFSLF